MNRVVFLELNSSVFLQVGFVKIQRGCFHLGGILILFLPLFLLHFVFQKPGRFNRIQTFTPEICFDSKARVTVAQSGSQATHKILNIPVCNSSAAKN